MGNSSEIIARLRKGEIIKCLDCKKGIYTTNAKDISVSHEFKCDNCNSVIRISPNITIN